jgi:DNA-binding FadR family transcriptional regulator
MSRLYRQVAGQIAELIEAGEFGINERLPAERHLSARLNVSRPTVREAIIALEFAGMVEVRAGSGVYVLSRTPSQLEAPDNAGASPLDLVNARLDIECAIIAKAARNMMDDDLARIAATIERMATAAERADYQAADREFHFLIAEATGNSVHGSIVEQLWSEMASPIFVRLSHISGLSEEHVPPAVDEHRAIHAALAARDGAAARAAMRTHLKNVRTFLQRDWNDAATQDQGLDAAE